MTQIVEHGRRCSSTIPPHSPLSAIMETFILKPRLTGHHDGRLAAIAIGMVRADQLRQEPAQKPRHMPDTSKATLADGL
ncbi:hypothetical protein [Novosphingobium sp.]|uniref:hypothetical protein n=1 Tax=Novosphingobium sp. TaxID=1874826 RepID=UPI0035B31C81